MVKRVRPRPEYAMQVRLEQKLREFEYPDLDTKPPSIPTEGVTFVIDVAAHNAPSWEKEGARYICDGVDDHIEIQQALDDVFLEGLNTGEVTLSSGSFYVDEGWIRINEGRVLRGQGQMATWIRNQTVGTLHDLPSSFNGVYLVHVDQDGELCDLSFFTTSGFQGTCVITNYGLVHDINHVGGSAQRFLYIRGSIGPTYNIRSWGTYNTVPVADRRAAIETDENWIALTGVSMSIRGTGLWIGDHQGGAAITGVVIEKQGVEPAIVIGDALYVALGDVSIRNVNNGIGPGIEVISYPQYVSLSNINIQGTSVGLKVRDDPTAGWWGVMSMEISNFTVTPFESGIDLHLGSTVADANHVADVRWFMLSGFRCDGSLSGRGTGWGIRLNSDGTQARFLISDFDIQNMDEDGIVLLGVSKDSIVHDGVLETIGKHGVILDSIGVNVHDVTVDGAGQAAANTYDAFHLKGTMSEPMLHHNHVLGRSQLRYGINIADAGVSDGVVLDNVIGDDGEYGTAAINDNGTGTTIRFIDGSGSGGGGGGVSSSKVAFSQAGTLTTGSGSFKLPFTLAAEIVSVQLAAGTSPTGADLIVDINKNGTTVFTTQANRPTVPDGDANGVGAEAVPDVTTIAEGDYLSVDIDQVGSTVAGEDLTVVVEWRPA